MFNSKQVASTYDQIGLNFSATRQNLSPEVISLLPKLPENASVLDLGCGNGVLLTAFDRRSLGEGGSISYLGIDISPTMIKEATGSDPAGKFILADILDQSTWKDLPAYDFIAALAVFHHLPRSNNHIKLLRNIKQHLKSNGSALVSVWRLDQPKFEKFRTSQHHLSIPFHSGPSRDFYSFTDDELAKLAGKAGFSDIKTKIIKNNLYLTLNP